MKFFVIIIHFFYIQLSHTISSPDLLSFLRTYLTPSNHKLEASVFRSTLLNYDSLPSSQKEAFQANDNLGVNSFLLTHRNFYSQKPKLKEIITFFPKILFSNSSNNEFSISESFESFLEELETTYTEELVQDYDKKHLFSNESFKIFEDLLENEDKPNIKRKDVRKFDFLSQEHRDKFRDFMDEFFEKKLQHNSDIYLEKLDDNIAVHKNFYYNQTQKEKKKQDTTDSFYENLTEYKQVHNNMSQEALKQKFNELINHTKTLDTIIGEHNLSLTDLQAHIVEKPHEFLLGVSHFLNLELNLTEGNNTYFPNIQNLTQNNKSNYSDFNISFLKMKEEIIGVLNYSKNDRISLNNTNITIVSEPNDTNSKTMTNKTNNIKSKLKTNFLKTITYNETKNKKKTENVISFLQTKDDFLDALSTQDSDKKCISPEQKNAIASAFEDLSKLEASNNEDAETLLNKKEVSYGKSKAQISMQLKMIIQLIKMVINAIVAIITGFFRIIVPPAILAFFSCPEAAFFPVNLIHIINFDEKTEQLLKKIEAFPAFYETFTQPNSPNSLYYMCAQGLFTSECSALWPKFNFIPFLITQPPFTVIPFLLFMPVIDWLQLLPGDLPMCFLCCIQVLLQCKGIKFSDIPQCGSLYTLDTLLRAIFDLALLVFLGLSMVPGLCTYNPFIINMWMIPPRLMSEEEKMLRKAPKLKELLKKTQKDPSFSDLGEGDCGNKDNKEEFPFGSPEDLLKGIQENGPNETTEGLEEPKDNWGIREIEGDYIAEHWEKNLAPENSIGNNFERKLIAGGKNSESSSGKVHETQKEKIDIVGERGKKSVSGDMGQREWEYPIGE